MQQIKICQAQTFSLPQWTAYKNPEKTNGVQVIHEEQLKEFLSQRSGAIVPKVLDYVEKAETFEDFEGKKWKLKIKKDYSTYDLFTTLEEEANFQLKQLQDKNIIDVNMAVASNPEYESTYCIIVYEEENS